MRKGRDLNQTFAKVVAERALSQASTGLLLPPRPSPPPHPLKGEVFFEEAFVPGDISMVAAEPAQCLQRWIGKLRTLVKALDGKRGRVRVGRIYVTIWKAIRSRYLASFASDNLTSNDETIKVKNKKDN